MMTSDPLDSSSLFLSSCVNSLSLSVCLRLKQIPALAALISSDVLVWHFRFGSRRPPSLLEPSSFVAHSVLSLRRCSNGVFVSAALRFYKSSGDSPLLKSVAAFFSRSPFSCCDGV